MVFSDFLFQRLRPSTMRLPTRWVRRRVRTDTKAKANFSWLNSVWSPMAVALLAATAAGYFNLKSTEEAFSNALKLEAARDKFSQQAERRKQAEEERQFRKRQLDEALLAYTDLAAQSLRAKLDLLFDLGDRGWDAKAFSRYDSIDRSLSAKTASAAVKLASSDQEVLKLAAPLFYEQAVINSHLWVARQWYRNNPRAANKRYDSIGQRANQLYQLLPQRIANVSAGKELDADLPAEVLLSINLDDLRAELTTLSPRLQRDVKLPGGRQPQ